MLSSEPSPALASNPYVSQLFQSLSGVPGLQVMPMSIGAVLVRRFDVLHVHWPEVLVRKRSRIRSYVAICLFAVLIARIYLADKPVVRTVHNLSPHESLPLASRFLVGLLLRRTTAEIHLSRWTTNHGSAPVRVVVPHGHYRDWYARFPRNASRAGHIAYFGLLRPYKGVGALLEAFGEIESHELTLSVAGRANDPQFLKQLKDRAATDSRVKLTDQFLSDGDLVELVTSAQLVILPYDYLVNSGAALLALSLNRPVLIREGDTADELRAEMGESWIRTFTGRLSSNDVLSALESTNRCGTDDEADLSQRDWNVAAQQHAAVFAEVSGRSAPQHDDRV